MARFKFNDDNVLASLDFGSSSIRCTVSYKKNQDLEFLSFYEKKCKGLEAGKVVDFQELTSVAADVLENSEKLSNTFFSEVVLGFSTPFRSFQSHGMAALPSREVTKKDRDLAIQTACAVPVPYQHLLLHHHPQDFIVDGKRGILNPIGFSGLRLEVEVYMLTIAQFYLQDVTKVLRSLGVKPRAFVNNLFSFGMHLTHFSQKKEGVCLCDIGHKSSRLITYHQGKILDMCEIPIGGEHFSLALAQKFQISPRSAEKLKERWGNLETSSIDEEKQVEMTEGEGMFFSYKLFADTLEQVAKVLFQKIKENMDLKQIEDKINIGYVFTGSTSLLKGFLDMAKNNLGKPVSYPYEVSLKENNLHQKNTFAIAQQYYLKDEFLSKDLSASRWFGLKDLF